MFKIRLKRLGAKKAPTYRVIVINSTTKREGKPIQELGHYNPKTKEMKLDIVSANEWVKKGAQPTDTVKYLMANCNEDGTLNYKKSEVVKLSKKAQAKKDAHIGCWDCGLQMDYWDLTDEDDPEIIEDFNNGLAHSSEGWYGYLMG